MNEPNEWQSFRELPWWGKLLNIKLGLALLLVTWPMLIGGALFLGADWVWQKLRGEK